jgi:gag-polypeptide of LTR copia-type
MRRRSGAMSAEATENVFAKTCTKLTPNEMAITVRVLAVCQAHVESKPKLVKVDLQSVKIKLDGSITYLSWSRWVRRALEGKNLDGYITGEMIVSAKGSAEYIEWRSINSLLHSEWRS